MGVIFNILLSSEHDFGTQNCLIRHDFEKIQINTLKINPIWKIKSLHANSKKISKFKFPNFISCLFMSGNYNVNLFLILYSPNKKSDIELVWNFCGLFILDNERGMMRKAIETFGRQTHSLNIKIQFDKGGLSSSLYNVCIYISASNFTSLGVMIKLHHLRENAFWKSFFHFSYLRQWKCLKF